MVLTDAPLNAKDATQRATLDYFREGPYIIAATLCESILQEGDPGLTSIIRLTEKLDASMVPPPGLTPEELAVVEIPRLPLPFKLIIALRGFPTLETTTLTLKTIRPSGAEGNFITIDDVNPAGSLHAVNIKIEGQVVIHENGIHIFEVGWSDRVLTRIPVELSLSLAPVLQN